MLLMLTLRAASATDAPVIRDLLATAALPVDDLESSEIDFVVAEQAGTVHGTVGVQALGNIGLLRSLAVSPAARTAGTGTALVDAIEAHAAARGIRRLVLLTETAAPFFMKRGYALADRATMPEALQDTAEFRSLCPSTATCLAKDLRHD
ncbi:GNAT family N-acetyltransferase [Luteimonas gilva]|uniref:GNAT family N-acetyltransferase n=2 Tax=Luteimonas gilva TaxID=2572684 RepID=A0A4U5JLL3_9GAMM|nr:GNAT family N-acetyltransferase [Luteimonas gilva]